MQSNTHFTKTCIKRTLNDTTWDFGNGILYDMCNRHPKHDKVEVVIGKVWLIGRVYAASIERRRKSAVREINDDFYVKTVGPAIVHADFDKYLDILQKHNEILEDNMPDILVVHNELMKIFNRITDLNKRALASKYLHFHKPELFFIYDSRVVSAMRHFQSSVPKHLKYILNMKSIDLEYAKYCLKALSLKNDMVKLIDKHISNRQFDSILIDLANSKEREKKDMVNTLK